MKHNTSTPSLLSLRGEEAGEGQSTTSVEWSLNCDFNQQQQKFSKVELSPSPPISSTETRRVSTALSGSGLSYISSSESSSSSASSIGFKTYDDTDDTTESSITTGEDDPIISFGALSLDTQRTTLGVAATPTRIGTILKTKTRGMNRTHEQDQESPKESLNLTSWDQHSWNSNSLETINIVPFAHLSDDSSTRPVSLPKVEKEQQQQRRTTTKKYTIKKAADSIQSISITNVECPKVSREKRQRGGSDFTMASASGVGDATTNSSSASTSPSSRRKRRRINRNLAMAAVDFDSILSQINTTGQS